ncbi:TlpA family protein disulfide reductase [Natronorubrum aibiense]|uniref:TlpA family protein disulfide reductase n=1 Tax=Natronorubrum aibiense TaxID=348826 RepID=A0A5P9P5I5_9EURY|nr:TlpA family protein disulfide reductase [Natronorubrum aibiense]QFU83429.1 TlpA family protein disulfide reductase [Natronorubrum aibiense]
MNRRTLLAATTAATTMTMAGCLDDGGGTEDETGSNEELTTPVDRSPPFDIRTVDAPGSEAGTVRIPQQGRVMLINFTRMFCPTSQGFLADVGDAVVRLRRRDIGILSVIDRSVGPQPSPEELADWWREHDGNWTIGMDKHGLLNDHYEISGFPVAIAIDGTGETHWRTDGPTTANNIASGVEAALEAQSRAE